MLLNVTIFLWFGATCPWAKFLQNDVIPIYRLVPLGILVLLFRRLPWVFAVHHLIPQIDEFKQALFVGFFGPIGVSAIFYLYIAVEFVRKLTEDGREDVKHLGETIRVVVWFLVICSIVSLSYRSFLGLAEATDAATFEVAFNQMLTFALQQGDSWLEHPPRKIRVLLAADVDAGSYRP